MCRCGACLKINLILDAEPEVISNAVSICENIPPKPPTSPIPLRITTVKEDHLHIKQPSFSGDCSCFHSFIYSFFLEV